MGNQIECDAAATNVEELSTLATNPINVELEPNDQRIAEIVDRQVVMDREVDRLFAEEEEDGASKLLGDMNDASRELINLPSDTIAGLLKKLEWLSADVNNNGYDISGAPIAEAVLTDIFAEVRRFSVGDGSN